MWEYGEVRAHLDELSDAQLCDYVTQMQSFEASAQAHKAAAHALIAERGCHERDGSKTLCSWIQETGRHGREHAQRVTDIAAAAADLPEIWACFSQGTLSEDQVAILARFATADTDTYWASEAPKLSVGQLQACASQHRKLERLAQEEAEAEAAATAGNAADSNAEAPVPEPEPAVEPEVKNRVRIEALADGSGIRLSGTFDPVMGAFIEAALLRQADTYPRDPETGHHRPLTERLAWALFDLVTSTRRANWADRAVVTIHADFSTVAGWDDNDAVVDWPRPARVSADELRRLLENALVDCSLDDLQGRPIGIGHISNQWPPVTQRRIQHRDKTCRWPGCSNTLGLEIHHEPPWPRGPTDTFHGLLLCVHHHQCRTSRGFRISGNPEAELQFHRPDGTLLGTSRPPLDPDLHDHFHT